MNTSAFYNPPASFAQRRAIYNMRRALKMDVKGIRDFKSREASEEIKILMKRIKNNGFPGGNEGGFNPDGVADYQTTEVGDG